jgi:ABC-type amino acid transport substrate-binding protein
MLSLALGCTGPGESRADGDPVQSQRPDLVPAAASRDRGDAYADLQQKGAGEVVVLFTPSPGWAHWASDRDSVPTGVTVDLLQDFFRWVETEDGVSLRVRWVEEPEWGRFYRRVRDAGGGVLGIGHVTITPERREELDFSPPYLSNVAVLITRNDVPELSSMADFARHFAGFTAYPFRGTLHEDRIERLRDLGIPDFQVQYVNSIDAILAAVQGGSDRLAWLDLYDFWLAVERGVPIRRHPAGDDHSESLGVILPRGSDWTPVLEAFLTEGNGYRNGARYEGLLRSHLGDGLAEALQGVRALSPDR